MAGGRPRIRDAGRESFAHGRASQRGRQGIDVMRLFYLIVASLLALSLGLLEVVTARSVALAP